MGIGNLGSPVPDSEERNARLLMAAGYNDATIKHCVPSYVPEHEATIDSGYPKMGTVVAHVGETIGVTSDLQKYISPLGQLPNEQSNQPRTSGNVKSGVYGDTESGSS